MYYPNPEETLRKQEEFRKRIENQRKYGVTSYKTDIQTRSSSTYKITKDLTHLRTQVKGIAGRCVREKDGKKIQTTKLISEEIQKLFVKYKMTSQENAKCSDVTDNRVSIVLEIKVNRSNTQKKLTIKGTKMMNNKKSKTLKNATKNTASSLEKPILCTEEKKYDLKSLQNKVILKIIPDQAEIKNEKINKIRIMGKLQAVKSKQMTDIFFSDEEEPIQALVLQFIGEDEGKTEEKEEKDTLVLVKNTNAPSEVNKSEVDLTVTSLPAKTLASRAVYYVGEMFQRASIHHYSITAVVCGGVLIGAYHADEVFNFIVKTSALAYGENYYKDSAITENSGFWGLLPKF